MAILKRSAATQNHGQKSETKVAKRIGAQQVAGSGSIQGNKGDLKIDGHLIECKATVKDSYSINLAQLRKITKEARDAASTPALHVSFVKQNGDPVKDGTWVMMREQDYRDLLETIRESKQE